MEETRDPKASTESGATRFPCNGGRRDCDGDDANGCEVDPQSDPAHCGSCERSELGRLRGLRAVWWWRTGWASLRRCGGW